ncbi:hypothetical protein OUZ56_015655 [Daphnia magna]|uniref:Uncharacterized protein n=1 Tax=Daphnia magna TaxID=35525 RepID=A0ABR0AND4_9CRUS|nr:hypothetical protein OUZ56_015655 [Daphnia magna]
MFPITVSDAVVDPVQDRLAVLIKESSGINPWIKWDGNLNKSQISDDSLAKLCLMFNRIFEYNAVCQKRMAADYLNFKMSLLWFRVTQSRTMRTPAPGFYSAIVPPICKTHSLQ